MCLRCAAAVTTSEWLRDHTAIAVAPTNLGSGFDAINIVKGGALINF